MSTAATLPDHRLRRLFLAVLMGCAGAFSIWLFRFVLSALERFVDGSDQGLVAAARLMPLWQRFLTPCAGALAAGLVLALAARVTRGGSPRPPSDYIEGILVGEGRLDPANSFFKCFASLLVVAGGLAVGREGAMILLSSLVSSLLAQRLAPKEDWPLLVACGAAAGVTAAYHAPLSGAFFAVEVIMGAMSPLIMGSVAIASVCSLLVTEALSGPSVLYSVAALPAPPLALYALFVPLAFVCSFVGSAFLKGMDRSKALFRTHCKNLPGPVRLALGGAMVGLLSLAVPEVWGNGFSVIQRCLADPPVLYLAALFLAAKVLAMLVSSGAGAPGGVFTPTLFVGATFGLIMAQLFSAWFIAPEHAPYITIICMGALLAATTHAPVMAALMVAEITAAYTLLPALLLACVLASAMARRLHGVSIYGLARGGVPA